jgi:hypothetical protein
MRSNHSVRRAFKTLLFVAAYLLTACNAHTQGNTMTPVFKPQALPFAFYRIDVPNDIDLDASIVQTGFWGNRFHAYPINSQAEFNALVKKRAQKYYDHVIPQKDLEYQRKEIESAQRVGDDATKAAYIDLKMTRALYKLIKFDEQRYEIVATAEADPNSFTLNLYGQRYLYVPQLKKYIWSKPARFPSTFAPQAEERGRKFLNEQIVYTTPETLKNTSAMAVGPVMWLKPDEHPIISYAMVSKQYDMEINLMSAGVRNDWSDVKETKDLEIKQIMIDTDKQADAIFSRSRNVQGLKGREDCIWVPANETNRPRPYYWCSWVTAGERDNLMKPAIDLEVKIYVGGKSDEAKAISTWEQLIGSLKTRGEVVKVGHVRVGDICPRTGFWRCSSLDFGPTGLYMLKGNTMPGESYRRDGMDVDNMVWEWIRDA